MNSIVIPVLNERQNVMLPRIVESLADVRDTTEILFVDGGSSDQTVGRLRDEGFRALETSAKSRGRRMQLGLEATVGEMVLFHHPRSVLSSDGLAWFAKCDDRAGWGGLTHKFDVDHPFLRFTSWYSNRVRGPRGVLYLDHCIFAPRAWLVRSGGVPDVEIFEDTELSKRLQGFGAPTIKPFISETSSIRFAKNGYLKQGVLNQWLKISYLLEA